MMSAECKQLYIAANVMKATDSNETFLPMNVVPGNFAHAAMDNIDINEETRSGSGTTHLLGSLIFQERSIPTDNHKKPESLRRKSVEKASINL